MSEPVPAGVCPHCAAADAGRRTGRYQVTCVGCCARLVLSYQPWREAAAAMLEAITRRPGRPSRAEIAAEVRRRSGG